MRSLDTEKAITANTLNGTALKTARQQIPDIPLRLFLGLVAVAVATAVRVFVSFDVELQRRRGFKQAWIDAFFAAMSADLTKKKYHTLAELEEYMYGSAEVVGLMMSQIMSLPRESHQAAQALGKAMQYINFLRDIAEDLSLGRTYIPQVFLKEVGLKTLTPDHVWQHQEAFIHLMRQEVERYYEWLMQAEKGFRTIPKRYLIPIKTATDMYTWTASTIFDDPMIVFRRKVKPTVPRVVSSVMYNTVSSYVT